MANLKKPDGEKCIVYSISTPEKIRDEADKRAAALKISRSAYITQVLEREHRMPQSGNGPAWGEVQEGGKP